MERILASYYFHKVSALEFCRITDYQEKERIDRFNRAVSAKVKAVVLYINVNEVDSAGLLAAPLE